jgi:hypothetical protein
MEAARHSSLVRMVPYLEGDGSIVAFFWLTLFGGSRLVMYSIRLVGIDAVCQLVTHRCWFKMISRQYYQGNAYSGILISWISWPTRLCRRQLSPVVNFTVCPANPIHFALTSSLEP